jgi:hypothetical protein
VFSGSVVAYGLAEPSLALDLGGFARGALVTATSTARVAIGFAPVPGLPASITLAARASARVEPWRSR